MPTIDPPWNYGGWDGGWRPCQCPECVPSTTAACLPSVLTIDRVVGRTREEVQARINKLLARRDNLLNYLGMKVDEQEWHGVEDAGSDLRDVDAELIGLRWVLSSE